MRVSELIHWLGEYVLLKTEPGSPEFEVECEVLDSRISYGVIHLQVRPVAGNGTTWVSTGRCRLMRDDERRGK